MRGNLSPLNLGVPLAELATKLLADTIFSDAVTALAQGAVDDTAATLDANYETLVPLTGFTRTIAVGKLGLFLKPAGTLATGTINLPATPTDGMEVTICSSEIITALTLGGGGTTVLGGVTDLAANTPVTYKAVTISATAYWMRSA